MRMNYQIIVISEMHHAWC